MRCVAAFLATALLIPAIIVGVSADGVAALPPKVTEVTPARLVPVIVTVLPPAVGPELGDIGLKQKRDYLLEAIVLPNKQIAKGYESVLITKTDGKTTMATAALMLNIARSSA